MFGILMHAIGHVSIMSHVSQAWHMFGYWQPKIVLEENMIIVYLNLMCFLFRSTIRLEPNGTYSKMMRDNSQFDWNQDILWTLQFLILIFIKELQFEILWNVAAGNRTFWLLLIVLKALSAHKEREECAVVVCVCLLLWRRTSLQQWEIAITTLEGFGIQKTCRVDGQ